MWTFSQEILDADDIPLRNHSGQLMARDIVQFVPFREIIRKSGSSLVGLLVLHMMYYVQDRMMFTDSCSIEYLRAKQNILRKGDHVLA